VRIVHRPIVRLIEATRAESEKTEWLARVLAAAEYVWDDREKAREWMSKPHRELNGQA
jgi:uncharacterized protein (DUF2384 family)